MTPLLPHRRVCVFMALLLTTTMGAVSSLDAAVLAGWSPEERLSNAPLASDVPALASDDAGHLHLVWEDNRDSSREIYYKEWDGATWSAETRLTNSPGQSLWPSIVTGSDGTVYVCWFDFRDGNGEIYFKRRVAGVWQPDERLTNDPAVSFRPSMAISDSDTVHVVWYDRRDDNFEIYHKSLGPSGWSADERLTNDAGSSTDPSVACGPSNAVHVVWSDDRSGDLELYSLDWNGTQWSTPFRLTNSAGVSQYPFVSTDPTGRVHVVWTDARQMTAQVFYKSFDGVSWSTDLAVSNSPYWIYHASGRADALGRVHVVWADQRDGNLEIYYREWNGSVWSNDQRLTIEPSGSLQPEVQTDASNVVHVVWSDQREGAGNSEIYHTSKLPEPPQLTITIADTTVAEGNAGTTAAVFAVALSAASLDTVKVSYQTANGNATLADNDYAAASGQLVFAPGDTVETVAVDVNGDLAMEPDETFLVNLSSPVNATLADSSATGTITNDDAAPPVTITIADTTFAEVNAGTTAAIFAVTLSAASLDTVKVSYQTANGTATLADNDYAAASGQLVFAPGDTVETVAVDVNGDLAVEPDETFLVNLSSPVNATIADSSATGTITNDDAAPPVTITIADTTVAEGNAGTTAAIFAVTLSAASLDTVKVSYQTANGSATLADNDYAAASGLLVFAPGDTVETVAVDVNGDLAVEPDETFLVNLSSPVNATLADSSATGTITNDDAAPPVTITIADTTVAEGNAGTTAAIFAVALSAASLDTVKVSYQTANGSATLADNDYAAASGQLVFAPGDTVETVAVDVNGDLAVEPDETFLVNFSSPVNATLADSSATGTITNDDAVPPVTVTIADTTVAEGNAGTTAAIFAVTLSAASLDTVKVSYQTANGSATLADNDYAAASGLLVFAPGDTVETVAVDVNGDLAVEPDETFLVNLSSPVNASIADSSATGTITNDDAAPPVTITIADTTVAEGNADTTAAVFAVALSAASLDTVKVSYQTANGSATLADNDYAAASGLLVFAPGDTVETVAVDVNGDLAVEPDETFLVNLSSPVNASIADSSATGTITNDDAAPPVTITIADTTVAEGNADTTAAVFAVALSAASLDTVKVSYQTANGSATLADNDYAAASGQLVFAPGDTVETVAVDVNGDLAVEPDETFLVNLSSPVNATLADSSATGTITNDDAAPPVTITIADTTVAEGNADTTAAVFAVALSAASLDTVKVSYQTANGSATLADNDYAAASGQLVFAPGDTVETVAVDVNGDLAVEPDETFLVNLSSPVNATLADSSATGTITNDDSQVAVEGPVPARTFLGAMYPNPFSSAATIPFGLAKAGALRIQIFDVHGRLVRSLRDGFEEQGDRLVTWDGRDGEGRPAAPGVYFIRMQQGSSVLRSQLVLAR